MFAIAALEIFDVSKEKSPQDALNSTIRNYTLKIYEEVAESRTLL